MSCFIFLVSPLVLKQFKKKVLIVKILKLIKGLVGQTDAQQTANANTINIR